MENQGFDQTYLAECTKTTRLIKEIKLYTLAMEAAFDASQRMMDAKPEPGENINELMVPWFELVQRFQSQHTEIIEIVQAKQTEFYEHYTPFQTWAEENGYLVPKESEKWHDFLQRD